ncbi:hypothetical protein SAMN02746095_03541, partial [Acidocella aminolytica 101 = DSM 11237]
MRDESVPYMKKDRKIHSCFKKFARKSNHQAMPDNVMIKCSGFSAK